LEVNIKPPAHFQIHPTEDMPLAKVIWARYDTSGVQEYLEKDVDWTLSNQNISFLMRERPFSHIWFLSRILSPFPS